MPLMEVDSREFDGLTVTFVYDSDTEISTIHVIDSKTEQHYAIECEKDSAPDCYRHPFAYIREAVLV
jgi:hypothetical protein